jgi:tripartite-type tricarboxylate transporter receptor subunit TctC
MNRAFLALVALLLAALSCLSHAAEPFPTKPLRIVVPYPAGGPVDIIGRGLGNKLSEDWKMGVVVDNRPGANEMIAASELARSPADGYTLLLATDSTFSQNEYLYKKLSYDPSALVPVSRLVFANLVLFVPSDFPASNVREFIAYARSNPNKINYGSAGVGNITHLSMAYVAKTQSLQMTHVPYRGLAPVIQDMLAGQVQAAFGVPSALESYIRAGKFKALAISGAKRAKLLPSVPTFAESGYPDIESSLNMGLFAPPGTPADVVSAIAAKAKAVVNDPAFKTKYVDELALEAAGDNPAEFSRFIAKDKPLQKRRIELSGAQLE